MIGKKAQPVLVTRRLKLRALKLEDLTQTCDLLADPEIAAMSMSVPQTNEPKLVKEWLVGHIEAWRRGQMAVYAITLRDGGQMIGVIWLGILKPTGPGRLSYWMGKEFRKQGYCTEAGRAIVRFGLEQLNLPRITALCFSRNVPSARVLERIGMVHVAHMPKGADYRGQSEDLDRYDIKADQLHLLEE